MESQLYIVTVVLTLVMVTIGLVFLIETLVSRDTGPGRLWTVAFLLGMLTSVSYLFWLTSETPWIAIAVGNAAYVLGTGFIWLACRASNGRSILVSGIVVAALGVAAAAMVIVAGPEGTSLAGAPVYFPAIALLGVLAAVETLRSPIRQDPMSMALTLAFGVEAVYFAARGVALLVHGPESTEVPWVLGSAANGILTVVLAIVIVLVVSTMRLRLRQRGALIFNLSDDQILSAPAFAASLGVALARAVNAAESVALIALRLDDLGTIGTAFGPDEQASVRAEWRRSVRRHAPVWALTGEGNDTTLLVAFASQSPVESRRITNALQRQTLDELARLNSSVIPVLGAGLALTDDIGWSATRLIEAASAAAAQSATSSDASIIVAEAV